MALDDGIQLLLERLEGERLRSAANDALSEELSAVLDHLRAQHQALQRARDAQEATNYVEAGRGEQYFRQGSTVATLVDRLTTVEATTATAIVRLVALKDKDEDHGAAAGEEAETASHRTSLVSVEAHSPHEAATQEVAIDQRTVSSFAKSCMERCQQLFDSHAATETELTEVFGQIQGLIPKAESFGDSGEVMAHTITSVNSAVATALSAKLSALALVKLVKPIRHLLLESRRRELLALSDSMGMRVLSAILPGSFRELLTTPQCIRLVWAALIQLELCDYHRSYDAKNMPLWLDFLEKKLSPTRIRIHRQAATSASKKITPLPFVFLTLAVVLHISVKLAPLDQIWDLAETLSKIKAKYNGDDKLIEIYQQKLVAFCKRRSTKGDADKDKLFDFAKELKLIEEKLAWYFNLRKRTGTSWPA